MDIGYKMQRIFLFDCVCLFLSVRLENFTDSDLKDDIFALSSLAAQSQTKPKIHRLGLIFN